MGTSKRVGMYRMAPKPCPRYKNMNAPAMKYCPQCAMLLDEQMALEEAQYGRMDELSQDEVMDAVDKGEKIDYERLAELVAVKMKGVQTAR